MIQDPKYIPNQALFCNMSWSGQTYLWAIFTCIVFRKVSVNECHLFWQFLSAPCNKSTVDLCWMCVFGIYAEESRITPQDYFVYPPSFSSQWSFSAVAQWVNVSFTKLSRDWTVLYLYSSYIHTAEYVTSYHFGQTLKICGMYKPQMICNYKS